MQTETLCLGLLTDGPKSGYTIKQLLSGPLNQMYNLSFGSIYPALNKLMDEKHVTCKQHTQDKKPDKKVYTITKKGIINFEEVLLSEASDYLRSGNYGDQIKSEFLMMLMFSKFMPTETLNLIIDERLLSMKQILNLVSYEGPASIQDETNTLRSSIQVKFVRGLMKEILATSLNYIEQNRKKLNVK